MIGGLSKSDPRLYNILKLLVTDLDATIQKIEPVIVESAKFSTQRATPPSLPAAFAGDNTKDNVRLYWTTPDGGAAAYEIREGGTGWDDANYITNSVATVVYLPPETTGTHVYKLKTISAFGVYSNDYLVANVLVDYVLAPNVSAQVIDNNVLLYWTEPGATYWIDYYEVWKTNNGSRTKVGEVSGLFTSVFEQAGGEYLYEIIAFDIAGNEGTPGYVTAIVSNPPDFANEENAVLDLATATLTGCVYDSSIPAIVAPINLTEQYESHFTTPPSPLDTWDTPQEQVDDGYSLWIQDNPTGTAAAVIEFAELDFGVSAAYTNILSNVTFVKEDLTTPDAPTTRVFVRTKPNGGAYTSWTEGANQFLAGPVRYAQVKIQIDNTTADSMCAISNAYLSLDVKKEIDSNYITANLADTGGTKVYVDGDPIDHPPTSGHSHKKYVDVDSITLSTESLGEPVTLIYDDTHADDLTDPYFTIYAYDSAGIRITKVVSWKIRGIVSNV
jgi:hypothetical protein